MAGPGPYAGEGEHSVQVNPAAQTRGDGRFDCADNRPLTADELRTYWRLIEKLPGLRGRCLRLHLLTGGQRIEQLVRLRWADVRADSITIYDTKGRPGRGARTHTVPIIKVAMRDLQSFERAGDHVFSPTNGIKPISGTTLSGWAAPWSAALGPWRACVAVVDGRSAAVAVLRRVARYSRP